MEKRVKSKITTKLIKEVLGTVEEIQDTEVKGFKLKFGKRNNTYVLRKKYNNKDIELVLGHYPELSPDEARKVAIQKIASIEYYGKPDISPKKIPTIKDTLELQFSKIKFNYTNNTVLEKFSLQGMIYNPCLNLYGTAVPNYFYESMSKRVLENGLIARCIVFESDKRGRGGNSKIIEKYISSDLIKKIRTITDVQVECDLLGKPTNIKEIPETEEATELLLHYRHQCDDNYTMFESIKEYTAMALWARVMEKVYKLSMIYAISENPSCPTITVQGVKWAFNFVNYATKLLLYRAGQYCYENDTDKKLKRIVTLLQERENDCLGKRDIYRKIGISAKEFDDLERTLIESERIAKCYDDGKLYYIALT